MGFFDTLLNLDVEIMCAQSRAWARAEERSAERRYNNYLANHRNDDKKKDEDVKEVKEEKKDQTDFKDVEEKKSEPVKIKAEQAINNTTNTQEQVAQNVSDAEAINAVQKLLQQEAVQQKSSLTQLQENFEKMENVNIVDGMSYDLTSEHIAQITQNVIMQMLPMIMSQMTNGQMQVNNNNIPPQVLNQIQNQTMQQLNQNPNFIPQQKQEKKKKFDKYADKKDKVK